MNNLPKLYLDGDDLAVDGELDGDGDLRLHFIGAGGSVYLNGRDRSELRKHLEAIDGIQQRSIQQFALSAGDSPIAEAIRDLADAVRTVADSKVTNVTNSFFSPAAAPEAIVKAIDAQDTVREAVKPFGVGQPPEDADPVEWNVAALQHAIDNHMAVRFTYRKPSVVGRRLADDPDTKDRFFRPSKVEYVGPEWDRYAITTGYDIDDDMPKTFRLDRVQGFVVVDHTTQLIPEEELSP